MYSAFLSLSRSGVWPLACRLGRCSQLLCSSRGTPPQWAWCHSGSARPPRGHWSSGCVPHADRDPRLKEINMVKVVTIENDIANSPYNIICTTRESFNIWSEGRRLRVWGNNSGKFNGWANCYYYNSIIFLLLVTVMLIQRLDHSETTIYSPDHGWRVPRDRSEELTFRRTSANYSHPCHSPMASLKTRAVWRYIYIYIGSMQA